MDIILSLKSFQLSKAKEWSDQCKIMNKEKYFVFVVAFCNFYGKENVTRKEKKRSVDQRHEHEMKIVFITKQTLEVVSNFSIHLNS